MQNQRRSNALYPTKFPTARSIDAPETRPQETACADPPPAPFNRRQFATAARADQSALWPMDENQKGVYMI
jgi:hypothetical protein